jgi:hypothetical protein
MSVAAALLHNASYYVREAPGVLFLFVIGLVSVWVLMRVGARLEGDLGAIYLYLSWAASVLAVAMIAPAYDPRYVLFAFPACIALGCEVVFRVLTSIVSIRMATVTVATAAAVFCLIEARIEPQWFSGPELVASRLASAGIGRTLYFGFGNGSFIFETRRQCPDLHCLVFQGSKLLMNRMEDWRWWRNSGFDPAQVEKFARDYGVSAVVFEAEQGHTDWPLPPDQTGRVSRWFEEDIETSIASRRGKLLVYRVTGSSQVPRNDLREAISIFGSTENFDLSNR